MLLKKKFEKTSWGRRIMFSGNNSDIRFALYYYNDDPETLYLANLFVDEKLRKNGLGNEIINYVFDYAKTNHYRSIILNVVKDSWVQKWYERKGFQYIEDCKDEYVGNVWMIKDI